MRGFPLTYSGEIRMDTRERILNAAMQAFSEKGFNGVSVDEIAKRAGVKKALIYYYFPSKDRIFKEVWDRSLDELEKHLFDEIENEKSYMKKLKGFLKAYIDFVTNRKVISEVINKERASVMSEDKWADLRDRYEGFLDKVANLIDEGKKYNAIYDDIDPVAAANLIFGSMVHSEKPGILEKVISMIMRGILKK